MPVEAKPMEWQFGAFVGKDGEEEVCDNLCLDLGGVQE